MTPDEKNAREVLWLAGHHALCNPCIERLRAISTALRACADVDPAVRAAFAAYQHNPRYEPARRDLSTALETLLDSLHPEGACTP